MKNTTTSVPVRLNQPIASESLNDPNNIQQKMVRSASTTPRKSRHVSPR